MLKNIYYLLLVLILMTSCVSKSKYDDLQDELSEKEETISNLENQISRLQSELRNCQSEWENIHKFNTVVKSSSKLNSTSSINTIQGRVIYEGRGDYYIVETQSYYVLLEPLCGWLNEGDILNGDLHSFGLKKVLKNGKDVLDVDIEDYWSDINRCYDWLKDHDKLR